MIVPTLDKVEVVALSRMIRRKLLIPIRAKMEGQWHKGIVRCLRHMQRNMTKEGSRTKRKVREK